MIILVLKDLSIFVFGFKKMAGTVS